MPMRRSSARSPRSPSTRSRNGDAVSSTVVIDHAMTSAVHHSQMRSGSAEDSNSRIAIVDGPATIGIASGTINGSGDYGFLLSVIDGGNTGDKFRIKIWNKSANDIVVYDNLLADAGDDALPTTGIMGGNIVVHAK